MVKFTKAYPLDYLYMKAKKSTIPWSLPLCEVLNGKLLSDRITEDEIVLASDVKEEQWVYTRNEFKVMLCRALEKWQPQFCGEITDFAVQPEGEMMNSEVFHFLEKYEK